MYFAIGNSDMICSVVGMGTTVMRQGLIDATGLG